MYDSDREYLSRFSLDPAIEYGFEDLYGSDFSYEEEIKFDDRWIWERDIMWLNEADVLVAEVTSPSLGVGYEIGKAEELGIPILCLYQRNEKKLSAMIGGSKYLKVVEYKEEHQAMQAIDDFLSVLT